MERLPRLISQAFFNSPGALINLLPFFQRTMTAHVLGDGGTDPRLAREPPLPDMHHLSSPVTRQSLQQGGCFAQTRTGRLPARCPKMQVG